MRPSNFSTAALYTASAIAASCNYSAEHPTVRIDSGIVAGIPISIPSSNIVVNKFLGIPYAERPVRFSPPVPVLAWESIYDGSAYKPSCLQMFRGTGEDRARRVKQFNTPPPPAGESEDCLNLNVYAPAGAETGSRPVMFWIHGGNLEFGSSSLPLYDGSKFVAFEDVVVVTINYRINAFGFPGSPDLHIGQKNLGFLDQRLALDWTRRNIRAFGGDPDKITIFGESAGGFSVDALIISPPKPIPFRAAIMQSGQASVRHTPWKGSGDAWAELVKALKCDCDEQLDCMRAVPALELKRIAEEKSLTFEPESDGGVTFADDLRHNRLASKEQQDLIAKVPILIGTNADEGRFDGLQGLNFEVAIARLTGHSDAIPKQRIETLKKIYAIGSPGIETPFDQTSMFITDLGGLCPTMLFSTDSVSAGIDTWRYLFDASFPNSEIFPGSGAYHSAEIELVFGTYDEESATELQKQVSRDMLKAWATFAKDPEAGPGWDRVQKIAVFGGGIRAGSEKKHGEMFEVRDSEDVDARCAMILQLIAAAQKG